MGIHDCRTNGERERTAMQPCLRALMSWKRISGA